MFNTLRKLFSKPAERPVVATDARPVAPVKAQVEANNTQPAPQSPVAKGAPNISIPLKAIISKLPADIMSRVRWSDVSAVEVCFPTQKLVAQLSRGAVKVSFGELKQACPKGLFSETADKDSALIELPLNEVLARVTPGNLTRRPAQKQVKIPEDVVGPFGGQTKVAISSTPLTTPPAVPPQPIQENTSVFRKSSFSVVPSLATPEALEPISVSPPGKPENTDTVSSAGESAPGAPLAPIAPIQMKVPVQPKAAAAPEIRHIAAPQPFKFPDPSKPAVAVAPLQMPPPRAVTPAPRPVVPSVAPIKPFEREQVRLTPPAAPKPTPPSPSSGETKFIEVKIADLCPAWPEPLKQEILRQNMGGLMAALPFGLIERSIKLGKVVFNWQQIRSWVTPALPAGSASPHDGVMLDLPMKVIIPLFMAEMHGSRARKKVTVDENIPNLFSNIPAPEPLAEAPAPVAPVPAPVPEPLEKPAATVAAQVASPVEPQMASPLSFAPRGTQPVITPPTPPVTATAQSASAPAEAPKPPQTSDTNYFVWKESQENIVDENVEIKTGTVSPNTSFLRRYATPKEIVNKAASLEGVSGAIVALADGLLVASKIPADMNGETMAAFLPQIFGRVSQSTRELRMGELNNLNFTVGNIPWKIFRVGSIYFAAFGQAGRSLPTAQLTSVAAELDRQAK